MIYLRFKNYFEYFTVLSIVVIPIFNSLKQSVCVAFLYRLENFFKALTNSIIT